MEMSHREAVDLSVILQEMCAPPMVLAVRDGGHEDFVRPARRRLEECLLAHWRENGCTFPDTCEEARGVAAGTCEADEPRPAEPHMDLLESAWGVIANAGWDDGAKSPGWQEAAVRWRDRYHLWLDLHLRPGGYQTWEELAVGVTRERDALFAEVWELRQALRDFKACEPVAPIPAFVSEDAP